MQWILPLRWCCGGVCLRKRTVSAGPPGGCPRWGSALTPGQRGLRPQCLQPAHGIPPSIPSIVRRPKVRLERLSARRVVAAGEHSGQRESNGEQGNPSAWDLEYVLKKVRQSGTSFSYVGACRLRHYGGRLWTKGSVSSNDFVNFSPVLTSAAFISAGEHVGVQEASDKGIRRALMRLQ